ncbi:hypothetical protein SMACR_01771 [Sordaria macrospora]|uniref:Uncharacterized protein n=1 Tax=Sordaria macrospora TaxID=5147 RepID=A0A8S9A2T4_SORMA|nr:hypothetical protein SMACR_01771 [Sordaria macrospora]WPJ61462.1 hypothetical protein SMAC4_01771 [Sordaria macrospora]
MTATTSFRDGSAGGGGGEQRSGSAVVDEQGQEQGQGGGALNRERKWDDGFPFPLTEEPGHRQERLAARGTGSRIGTGKGNDRSTGVSQNGHRAQGNGGDGNGTSLDNNDKGQQPLLQQSSSGTSNSKDLYGHNHNHMSLVSDPPSSNDTDTDFYSASDTDTQSSTDSSDSEEDRRISTELHREVFFSAVGEEEGYELTSTNTKKKSTRKSKRKGRKGNRKRGTSKFPDLDDGLLDSGRRGRRQRQRGVSVSTATSGKSFRKKLRYTPEEERAVVKKFDRKLVLFVALLYMLSFLDRSSEFWLSVVLGFDERLSYAFGIVYFHKLPFPGLFSHG